MFRFFLFLIQLVQIGSIVWRGYVASFLVFCLPRSAVATGLEELESFLFSRNMSVRSPPSSSLESGSVPEPPAESTLDPGFESGFDS